MSPSGPGNVLRVCDLFSGIGGFSLGLRMAGGFETVQFCEIEPYCQKVLAKNFPGVPIHDDIRSFQPTRGSADLVVGGFPCQPFSVAGKQAGTADDRDLWPQMARVISAVRPAWVIGENVAGFVNMELDRSLSDLESLGYACQALVIPACATDAPHRRDRVWIVAHADSNRPQERINDAGAGDGADAGQQSGGPAFGVSSKTVATDPQCGFGSLGRAIGRDGRLGESVSGHGDWPFTHKPVLDGRVHGIPRRVDRLRGLGNAVVPQVVEQIGRAIIEAERLTHVDRAD
jgi:DNA (cytosine-5)-methyltransferase 1